VGISDEVYIQMAATYRITATPSLYTQGEHQGKLKGVTFTASSPYDTREWFSKNCGQFQEAFAKILDSGMATVIASSLAQGDVVEFPGLYEEHQFARGFMFEWSPVYFVAPPRFAFER
jgi:hypothetical protein